jgi:4-hydroxybenzoate polyprenyltransferase
MPMNPADRFQRGLAGLSDRARRLHHHALIYAQPYGAYARLMRLDKPVGIWLLLWPTLWALWIAGSGRPDELVFTVFVLGTVVMRSAGCIINDFADRDIDPHVRRTRDRPLATRQVSVPEALLLFLGLLLIALGLVMALNPVTRWYALGGAMITVVYPFTKRFLSTPQFVLGVAFAWGVPMAFAAQTGAVPRVGWLLFVATVVWGVIYDTEYAMADREDDLKIGVRSTAILFAELDRVFIGGLQCMLLAALVLVGRAAELEHWYYAGLTLAALFGLYQQILIRQRVPENCFRAFRNNVWLGAAVFAGVLLDYIFRAP